MTKLSIALIVVCSIVFGISSFAERVEDSPPTLIQEERPNLDLDDQGEETGRAGGRATASASGNAQVRFRPGSAPGALNPASGLGSCYICADCPSIQPNVSSKLCPPSYDTARNRKCVVYKEKYNHVERPWTIRGCASERGSCTKIRAAHAQQRGLVKLLSCNECDGDLCNTSGVGHSTSSFIVGTLAILVTPLLVKNLLA